MVNVIPGRTENNMKYLSSYFDECLLPQFVNTKYHAISKIRIGIKCATSNTKQMGCKIFNDIDN